ncbi:MAG TPA: tetratricopeptide repeat protein [Rhizobacter sp.]|nr:tetratricopeptide repeat protein [Rhizobacter sp.]
MKRCTLLLICLLLTACASAPPAPPVQPQLFNDALFEPPEQAVGPQQIFALTDGMRRYVDAELSSQVRTKGLRQGLLDALYRKNQLRLEYDSERTRNAAEAFEARSGNCLSLVIMTAAIAKYMGIQVSYQSVYIDEVWTRSDDIYFASGHVNLTLGQPLIEARSDSRTTWTIDFLPSEDLRGLRSREVGESTIVAMYMNNRAAETLADGDLNAAYAWARAAVTHEPRFLSAYNTLGVIYLRHGQPQLAEQAFAQVLQRSPESTVAMSNMVRTLSVQGRADEAAALSQRLARLDPEPPFYFFERGRAAYQQGDYASARLWFAKEVARAPYHHEFHFWLAQTEAQLGNMKAARSQLALALSTSTTRKNQQLYAAKLDRLKHRELQ